MNRRAFLLSTISSVALSSQFARAVTVNNTKKNLSEFFKNQNSKKILIPPGDYYFDGTSINIDSMSEIIFSDGANIYIDAHKSNRSAAIFNIAGAKNIQISGGNFIAEDDLIVVVQCVDYVENITVKKIKCIGCRILSSKMTQRYSDILIERISQDVNVLSCSANAKQIKTNHACIELSYINGGRCGNNIISAFYHGIMFWGGDSNPVKDGEPHNERKCTALVINNNIIRDVRLGGIWGSMGERVSITANYVENGGDVGIDFEGCNNSIAKNNIVKNFKHGCLATFFICNNIIFKNNLALNSGLYGKSIAAIFNASQKPLNKNINFIGNVFVSEGLISYFKQNGATDYLNVRNNYFGNVIVDFTSNNNGDIDISDNKFKYDTIIDKMASTIRVGNVKKASASIKIANNTFINIPSENFKAIQFFRIEPNKRLSVKTNNNVLNNVLINKDQISYQN